MFLDEKKNIITSNENTRDSVMEREQETERGRERDRAAVAMEVGH